MSDKRKLFSPEEKLTLQELVLKYKHILENKKSDVVTVLKKKQTWKALTLEFNSLPHVTQRNENSLKKCWENMKTLKKKQIATEKIERMKTGGGGYKPPTEEPNPELEILMDDNVNVEIRDSVDSDSLFETSSTHTEEHTQPRPSSSKCTSIAPEDEEMETVGTFTVSEDGTLQEEVPQIKDTTSRTKSTKTHSHTTSRHQAIETELNIRVNKVKRMQEMEEELHARRMQMEEEMHAYRMKSENEMHVRRMEREEELHRIHVRQQEFLAEKLKAEMEKAKADTKF